jgi:PAS domain S-box-containing protein
MTNTTNDREEPSPAYSRSTLAYVGVVGTIGSAAILHSLWQVVVRPTDWHWLLLAALTVAGSAAMLRMQSVPVSFSIAELFTFSALLLFGPAVGTLTVAIDCIAISIRLSLRGLPWPRWVLNVTAPALGMWVAGHLLFAFADVNQYLYAHLEFAELVLPLSAAAMLYFLLDTGMIAVAIALEERRSVWQVWRQNFTQLWLTFLVGAHAAGIIVVALGGLGLSFLVIVAPLPLLLYYAMWTWTARVNEHLRHLAHENEQSHRLQEQQRLQLETEVALRERDHQFLAVFDSALDALLLVDDERRVLNANPAACALFGVERETLRSIPIDQFLAKASSDEIATKWPEMLTSGEHKGELVVAPADGEHIVEFTFKAAVVPGRHLFIWRDVSERRRLEAQLRQSQKMETVGRLAGGVAHDFNNLLTVILGNAGMALPTADHDAKEAITEVINAADRAANLTRQLLAFSRKQVLQTRVLSINTIVGGIEKMLRRLLDESIDLQTVLDPAVGSVKVDTSQIEQVIVNLVVNAKDAMPNGGRLVIVTSNAEVGPRTFGRAGSDVAPGSYVRLTVTDSGIGMDDATRSKIFEPFFTTKTRDKGTGLGLAMVYGIVRQSGGHLTVQSTPGMGSTFSIYLPKVEQAAAVQEQHRNEGAGPLAGSETILLVEDEDAVRSLATLVLKKRGYTVVAAANGEEACRLASEHRIDLLVTDVVMPRMNGKELASILRGRISNLRVVFMSGYTGEAVALQATRDMLFLQKPFSPVGLATIVRQALDTPVAAAVSK